MIWKELKTGKYKNHVYYIYGKYTEEYQVEFRGRRYKENIATKIKIMNLLGDVIEEIDWLEHYHRTREELHYQYLIRFRLVYKYRWWKMFGEAKNVIHIEDDYYRALDDWSKYCEEFIDENLKEHEREKYEQGITDGLPESIFKRYTDH